MREDSGRTRNRPPPLRLASFAATSLGGLLVGLGSLLDWGSIAVRIPGTAGSGLTSNVPGVDLTEGKITLIIGFALLVIGVLMRGISSKSTARILGWVIVAVSIAATGIAVLDVVRKDSAFDTGAQDTAHKIANTTGLPYNDILTRIEKYLVVDLKLGIYLVIVGGILGLFGGLLGIAWVSGRDRGTGEAVTDAPLPPDASTPPPPPEPGAAPPAQAPPAQAPPAEAPPAEASPPPSDPGGTQIPPD
ncbi:MAG: hypothetical protein ACJ758_07265 [Actinomycetota bacterium]